MNISVRKNRTKVNIIYESESSQSVHWKKHYILIYAKLFDVAIGNISGVYEPLSATI